MCLLRCNSLVVVLFSLRWVFSLHLISNKCCNFVRVLSLFWCEYVFSFPNCISFDMMDNFYSLFPVRFMDVLDRLYQEFYRCIRKSCRLLGYTGTVKEGGHMHCIRCTYCKNYIRIQISLPPFSSCVPLNFLSLRF